MHCVSEKLVVHNSGKMLDFQDAVTVVFSNKFALNLMPTSPTTP